MPEKTTVLTDLVTAFDSVPPGFVWGIALVVSLAYAMRQARDCGLNERAMYFTGACAIIGGILGSHLLGLFVYRSTNSVPDVWWHVWEGGKSFYGGLAGGLFSALAYLVWRRLPVLKYCDAITPAVGLGYAIGRLACFINGDDYGILGSGWYTVQYPQETEAFYAHALSQKIITSSPRSLPVHPAQLYASMLGLVLFLVLRKQRPAGVRLALFAMLYGAGRFALELVRGDFAPLYGLLSLQQVISTGLIFAGAALLIFSSRREKTSEPAATAVPPLIEKQAVRV